jgi:hypothetical protein
MAFAGMLLALSGCNTLRFNVADAEAGWVLTERHSFFLWKLSPVARIDMQKKCPWGVVAITEETTLADAFGDLLTLGLWSPRSATYTCRAAPTGS